METWVLIIAMYKTGLTQIEYSTKEHCQTALVELQNMTVSLYRLNGVACIKKN